jgi:hypothetical protein
MNRNSKLTFIALRCVFTAVEESYRVVCVCVGVIACVCVCVGLCACV